MKEYTIKAQSDAVLKMEKGSVHLKGVIDNNGHMFLRN